MKPRGLLLLLVAAAGFAVPLRAQISNGTLESWGTTSGTPPVGAPTGWNTTGIVKAPGLVSGSTSSAYVQVGESLVEYPATPLTSFDLSFDFAASDPGSSSTRSFNLSLNDSSAANTIYMNLRLVQGTTAGMLTLQAFGGSWTTIAANAFSASVYNSASNTFTTLNTYNLDISANFTTGTYTISYGAPGAASPTVLSNLSLFQNAPAGAALGYMDFLGGNSSAGYAIDNVTLTATPEPSAAALFGVAGALAVAAVRRRIVRA